MDNMQDIEWFKRNIKFRSFLTKADLSNKWIIRGIGCVINVSSDHNDEVFRGLLEMGIQYNWFPMSEQNQDMGLHSLFGALQMLMSCVKRRIPCIIDCMGGNNRSKVVYESLHYICFSSWPFDVEESAVYKNCNQGHLPAITEYQRFISMIRAGIPLDEILRKINLQ